MKNSRERGRKFSCIIGVDPGTRITGFGVISLEVRGMVPLDFGCIRPPSSATSSERYRIIFEGLTEILKKYEPESVAVETQFINKNVQSGIKLGMARGMVLLAASLLEIPIFEYAPTKAKKAVVGTGRASKRQVQEMIKRLLKLNTIPEPEDAADALALAICHAHASKSGWHMHCRI